jgi:hypothetical protein
MGLRQKRFSSTDWRPTESGIKTHFTSMAFNSSVSPPRLIRFYRWIWRFWKERRFQCFIQTLQPNSDETLLDIGGYPFNWFQRGGLIGQVDVLNLELSPLQNPPIGAPLIRAISGDARCLGFADGTYDIVFSNSVIEHVGEIEDQEAFAAEARRVGGKLWIQTPAKGCPVEPHYLGLFIHWFPALWHANMARWFSVRGLTGSASKADLAEIARSTRLLTKKEMCRLFPDCEIRTERLLGIMPKSYIAIRRNLQAKRESDHS